MKHVPGNRQTGKGIQKLNERKRINAQNRKKDCMYMHDPEPDSDLHPVCNTCPAIQDGNLSMSPVTGPTVLKSL